jgi:hypothetical protein
MSLVKTGRDSEEHHHQASIFNWAETLIYKYPELDLLNGSLNGVRLTKAQAGKAKATGMKKGYPDLHLPVAKGIYHGLYIELKTKKGRVTPDQNKWLQMLANQGYSCHVCRGSEAAIGVICQYLEGKL